MNRHLVISYSRHDGALMLRVQAYLKSRGITVWSDDHLQPGTSSWTTAIETAIDNSVGLLVVLSPSAKGSEWVAKEIRYAGAQHKFIFPLLALGEPARAVPFQLIDVEFTDIRTDFEAGMARLLDAIRERLQVLDVQSTAEVLRFSAQAPPRILRDAWSPIFAYVYHVSASGTVSEDMARIAAAGWHATGPQEPRSSFPDPRLIGVAISPTGAEGLLFNPRRIAVDVHDVWQRFECWVRVASSYSNPTARAAISFGLDGPIEVPFAEVILELSLEGHDSGPTDRVIAEAEAYRTVFACYSHADAPVVKTVAETYRALGTHVLQDITSFGSGEEWTRNLKRLIDRADIFQLFWSRAAAQSAEVEREWRYALSLNRSNFIRPVYWERPLPPPPRELAHLHFAYLSLQIGEGR